MCGVQDVGFGARVESLRFLLPNPMVLRYNPVIDGLGFRALRL